MYLSFFFLIGDFFQLPPIADYDDPASGEFCFQNPRWSATFKPEDCIELKTFFRQRDPVYIGILQEIRQGRRIVPFTRGERARVGECVWLREMREGGGQSVFLSFP